VMAESDSLGHTGEVRSPVPKDTRSDERMVLHQGPLIGR
jgi:hypothetical protein